jgi:RecG-like helicase
MYVNKFRDEVTEEYIQRLRLLEKFNKGSKLAEQDMLLRGFGDLSNLGVSQSGMSKSIFIGAKVLPEDLLSVINE